VSKPGRGIARLVRSGAAAVGTTALAVLGHVLGGGTVHAGLALLVLLWVAAGAYVLAACRLSFGRLLSLVGLGQVAFHGAFVLAHPASDPSAPAAAAFDPAMLAGHLLAAVATAALLARGEAALWSLARLLDRTVAAVRLARRALARAPQLLSAPAEHAGCARLSDCLLVASQPRRGPPARPAA
jgi:hypothetical protein